MLMAMLTRVGDGPSMANVLADGDDASGSAAGGSSADLCGGGGDDDDESPGDSRGGGGGGGGARRRAPSRSKTPEPNDDDDGAPSPGRSLHRGSSWDKGLADAADAARNAAAAEGEEGEAGKGGKGRQRRPSDTDVTWADDAMKLQIAGAGASETSETEAVVTPGGGVKVGRFNVKSDKESVDAAAAAAAADANRRDASAEPGKFRAQSPESRSGGDDADGDAIPRAPSWWAEDLESSVRKEQLALNALIIDGLEEHHA